MRSSPPSTSTRLTPLPPSESGCAAPDADRREFADAGDAVVDQKPVTQSLESSNSPPRPLSESGRAAPQRRPRIKVSSPSARTLTSVPELRSVQPGRADPRQTVRSGRSAEYGSKSVRRQCGHCRRFQTPIRPTGIVPTLAKQSGPGRAAPNADRSELADTEDAVVGQEPSHPVLGLIQPSYSPAIRIWARSAERRSKGARRQCGHGRRFEARSDQPGTSRPSLAIRLWARSAEYGSNSNLSLE
jgi:hypothetical protein